MKSTILVLVAASTLALSHVAGLTGPQRFIAAPLVGYQQGVTLQIEPPSRSVILSGPQCVVYGVPIPTGMAIQASTPLFLFTPSNTGIHAMQFSYNTSAYTLSPFLAPGQTQMQVNASDPTNPVISFNSSSAPQGQQGALTVYLSDKVNGTVYCLSQIQFTIDAALSCLPIYGGGVNPGFALTSTPVYPSSAGNFIIPSGQVYYPPFVQNTIVQQFVSTYNITNVVAANSPQLAPASARTFPGAPTQSSPLPFLSPSKPLTPPSASPPSAVLPSSG